MRFAKRASNPGRPPVGTVIALIGLVGWLGCGEPKTGSSPDPAAAARNERAAEIDRVFGPRLAPDATLAQALAHRDPIQRVKRVAEILDGAKPEELDKIQGAIEAAPLAWGDLEYALFAAWWARFDPSAALAYCDGELRLEHPRVVAEVLRMWGRTDPQAAIDSGWLVGRTLDARGLNPDFVDPLVVGWFESGQPGLENWIQSLDPTSKTAALSAYIRMKILADGPQKALEWTRTAPFTPDLQRLLLGQGLNIVARQDPPVAVEWLDRAAKEGIDVRTFVARIGRGWAHLDPRASMEWVMTRDVDAAERWRTVFDIARIWLTDDEKGIGEWIRSHATDAWVDVVRKQAIAHHLRTNDYQVDWQEMMKLASEFVNPEQRQLQYLWNIQRWKLVDPDGAAEWLAQNAELLGESIQYVEQVPPQDRKAIEDALAARKASGATTGGTVEADAPAAAAP